MNKHVIELMSTSKLNQTIGSFLFLQATGSCHKTPQPSCYSTFDSVFERDYIKNVPCSHPGLHITPFQGRQVSTPAFVTVKQA